VSQVTLVPGLLTRGRATQVVDPLQGEVTNFPATHCAKSPLMHALCPVVQGLSDVRVLNCALRFCASWPFCTAKPDEAGAGEPDGAGELLEVDVGDESATAPLALAAGDGDGDGDELLPEPELEGTPGDDTRSVSCAPAVIGPPGFAGQLPGGLKGEFCPNGIVPGLPTFWPLVKLLGSTPWNWHWKSPLSSALRGACWQYTTLSELGLLRGCWQKICANWIIDCEFSCLERSIMISALFCWSHGPAPARRVPKAATDI
jgi:hypothetical protein